MARFVPPSVKQRKVLAWWTKNSPVKDRTAIICDGAVRAGKTLFLGVSFVLWSMSHFEDQNFVISGKTVSSCKRNVITPLLPILKKDFGYSVQYKQTENYLDVSNGKVTNRYYIFGGKDESSADLIQGVTLAGILFDEVALMPRSFVEQGLARCSVEGSKFWFNCNPEAPSHWFYKEWICKCKSKNVYYLHFRMEDNPSLSRETLARYQTLYSGVFYQRFIMGLWVVATGIIYDGFEKEKHSYIEPLNKPARRCIAIDYGTTNPTAFLAIADDRPHVYVEKEYYYDSRKEGRQKTDDEYADDLEQFVKEWGYRPRFIIIDPSAASLRVLLRKRGWNVKEADNEVLDGIRQVSSLLSLGYLHIHESCTNLIQEFLSYVWDSKASEKGVERPIKEHDHALDALRYFVKTILTPRRFLAE